MTIITFPWALAAVTAVWFGWMAHRAGRNGVLWALGGGTLALVTATIIFGLGLSVDNPFCQSDRSAERLRWTIESVLAILVVGWLVTLSLHRNRAEVSNRPG